MKKRSLLIVVALLCMASLMAAMAFSNATVTSGQTLKVVSTDDALLSLMPGTGVGNNDNTAFVDENGILQINFGDSGIDKNGFPGLQPNSIYQWDKLISLWNKSSEDLDVTITVDGNVAEYLTITGSNVPNNWFTNKPVFTENISHTFTLGHDSTIPLAFSIDLPEGKVLGTFDGTITVTAVAK